MADSNERRRRVVGAPIPTTRSRLVDGPERFDNRQVPTNPERVRPRPRPQVSERPVDEPLYRWVVRAFVAMALLVVAFGVVKFLDDEGTISGIPAQTTATTAAGEQAEPAETSAEPTTEVPVASVVAPVPPYVQATLTGRDLLISGIVPNAELADGLGQAAQLVYAPFIQSQVMIDEQLPAPEWLAAAPVAVGLLQTITDGTVTVSEGRIAVTGRAASVEDIAELQRYLATTGLPVDVGNIEITNLRDAIYIIAASDGQLALSGALPSEEIRRGLADAAIAIYGNDNVFDASTADETVNATLWMYNPQALMATLSAFPDFEVRLDGGAFSATLSGAATFPPGSTTFTPEFAQVLNFGVVVMSRDPLMTMTIEGHTDSDGPDDFNLRLSQERADNVAAYFAAAGISPDRLTAIGVGEASPAAPNDTDEGRARNRRVEFTMESE